jgi:hypothetical protein
VTRRRAAGIFQTHDHIPLPAKFSLKATSQAIRSKGSRPNPVPQQRRVTNPGHRRHAPNRGDLLTGQLLDTADELRHIGEPLGERDSQVIRVKHTTRPLAHALRECPPLERYGLVRKLNKLGVAARCRANFLNGRQSRGIGERVDPVRGLPHLSRRPTCVFYPSRSVQQDVISVAVDSDDTFHVVCPGKLGSSLLNAAHPDFSLYQLHRFDVNDLHSLHFHHDREREGDFHRFGVAAARRQLAIR